MSTGTETKKEETKAFTVGTVPDENSNLNIKRAASDDDDDCGTDRKRPRQEEETAERLDVATVLGHKAGDRLEVKWDIHDEVTGQVQTRWWGASLLEHDGRYTDDGAAIRVLDYDPYPEGGFTESCIEEVVFVNDSQLLNAECNDMAYRKEGEEETVALDADDLRQELDTMLVGILHKHDAQWKNLPAAQQARIGEMIASGKESIITSIQNRWERDSNAISAAEIPSILDDAFQHLNKDEGL